MRKSLWSWPYVPSLQADQIPSVLYFENFEKMTVPVSLLIYQPLFGSLNMYLIL